MEMNWAERSAARSHAEHERRYGWLRSENRETVMNVLRSSPVIRETSRYTRKRARLRLRQGRAIRSGLFS